MKYFLFFTLVGLTVHSSINAMNCGKNGVCTSSGDSYAGTGNCFSGYGSGHCTSPCTNNSPSSNDSAGSGMSGMEAFTAGFSIGANIMSGALTRNPGKVIENIQAAKQLLGNQTVTANSQTVQWTAAGQALSQEEKNRIQEKMAAFWASQK